jgi:dolichyl-phosphate beta-glucosyltransferase
MKLYLSIIIPCYNEEKNLKRGVLEEIENYFKKQRYSSEVIISDDGSTDKSKDLVKEFIKNRGNFKLLENKHAGKASAVRSGVDQAQGEIVLFTDMDQSTPIREVEKLLPSFERGFEIVIGSRGGLRKNAPLYRQIAAFIFRFLRQLVLLKNIDDTQCGFKMFKTRAVKKLFNLLQVFKKKEEVKGWRVSAFDVELLFLAEKLGYKIKELPVSWEDKDVALGKKRNFIRESLEMLKEILRVKINDLRGVYG